MFTSVASVFHQAREELRKSQRPTIAASLSDHPVPLPLSTAVDSPSITHTPLPNPALLSLCGSSENFEQNILQIDMGDLTKSCAVPSSINLKLDIPQVDLGDPTSPFTVQPVKSESHVLIDESHLEEPSQPQSPETACCSSVFSFIKRLFTIY